MATGMTVSVFSASVSASSVVSRGGALLLWAATGFSASYWAMQMWGVMQPTPLPPLANERPPVNAAVVSKALAAGGQAVVAANATPVGDNYRLQGVLRDASGAGVALIVTAAGQVAKPYRLGASLPDGSVLLALQAREVLLGMAGGGGQQRLQLPALCNDQACKNKR